MATNFYDLGDVVRCTATFADDDGVVTDPTAVVAKYKEPDGTITTLTYGVDGALVKLGTGVYYFDLTPTVAGDWWYRFYATGSGQSAEEQAFRVEASQFA